MSENENGRARRSACTVQKRLWLKSRVCSVFARAAYRWELLNLRQYTGLVAGWAHSWKYCATNTR